MPTRKIARRRAPRGRRWPVEAAPATSARSTTPTRSLVVGGVATIVLGVPLAVLPSAAGPYDDPKAWALPILAGLTALAWLWRAWHAPVRAATPDPRDRWLGWLVLILVAWSTLATLISVAPAQSAVGGFGRGAGLLAMASATLLFCLVGRDARTTDDVRSLVDVALLGSVPVCIVALGQAVGWDPLPKPWDPAIVPLKVRSTLGAHIFLGSYLVVLIPLAAGRVGWAWQERSEWSTADRARVMS